MENFGAKQFIGTLVGLTMARELGPVMVAILIAGRVGSAITAELASMKVYQEIDALTTMNISPERMLVLPRLAAIVVMMPVLAIIANLCGWYGGALVCEYTKRSSPWSSDAYFAALKAYMKPRDIIDGLVKAEVFGFVIVLVCCYIGLNTRGGRARSAPPSPRPSSPPSSSSWCSTTSSPKPSSSHERRPHRHSVPRQDLRRHRLSQLTKKFGNTTVLHERGPSRSRPARSSASWAPAAPARPSS